MGNDVAILLEVVAVQERLLCLKHAGQIWLWQRLQQTSPAVAVPTPFSPAHKLPGALLTRYKPFIVC